MTPCIKVVGVDINGTAIVDSLSAGKADFQVGVCHYPSHRAPNVSVDAWQNVLSPRTMVLHLADK